MANSAGNTALNTLKVKMQSLREETDKVRESYEKKCEELEREKQIRIDSEAKLTTLSRKLRELEDECDDTGSKLQEVNHKLLELGKVSDENERAKRALENRQTLDDDRTITLERLLKDATIAAEEAERKYEQAARKLQESEIQLEQLEEKADAGESKVKQLDTELHIASTSLKSLTIHESKATKKEDTYEGTIKDLSARLKNVEGQSLEFEEKATRLQKDADRLEGEVERMVAENKRLKEEMDVALQEIQNM